jgi:serine incorporator 1/3
MPDIETNKEESVQTATNNNESSRKEEATDTNGEKRKKFELQTGSKGIYLSFFLLISGMVASIIAQRYAINNFNTSSDWLSGCPNGYDESCVGNSAVYRFSFALVIVYTLQLIGTTVHVDFFDALWIFKLLIFIGIVVGFYYADADVFDDRGYAWFARFAGFLYVILQQIILIDFAYTLNEKLIAMAEDDTESKKWYALILILAIVLFAGSYVVIGIMFWQFTGCASNDAILSLTLALPIIATLIQVFASHEGSILTSAIMTAYATYVCYSAITLNPRSSCNPTISTSYQQISTVSMLLLTQTSSCIFHSYNNKCTGYRLSSHSAVIVLDCLQNRYAIATLARLHIDIHFYTVNIVSQIPGALKKGNPNAGLGAPKEEPDTPSLRVIFQEVSVVFILISAYYCMVLTNWATLQSSSSISDPRYGDIALWLQASAQWIAILFYIWTLFAPKFFPDRDFSS